MLFFLFCIQCPEDDSFVDGSSCHENGGTCFHGMCVGAQQQCVELWGPGEFLNKIYFIFLILMIYIDAKVAHDSCYTDFNPSGTMIGHCGYDSRLYKYIPCFDK
jgi:hypothetical protein